jgi:hypothetical protein
MTEQTRFKYGLILCALVFVEGIVKHFLPGFPFDMAVAIQGAALGVYTVAESVNNSTRVNAASKAAIAGASCANGTPK